jgi:hypothetical protein
MKYFLSIRFHLLSRKLRERRRGRTAAPREKGAKTKAAEFTEIRKLGRKNYSIKQRPA